MLLSETVQLKWNSKIKQHYVDLGYTFTKMKEPFDVNVEHLTDGSCADVIVKCDYCGKEYTKKWYRYLLENEKSVIHKDCCIECRKLKIIESTENTYGVSTQFKRESIKDQIKKTNVELYGAENPFSSNEIKERIKSSLIEKYGVDSPLKSSEIIEKVKTTCKERYGVDYYVLNYKLSGELHPKWKGGISRERSERLTYDYIKWRKSVYSRDGYSCQCCGNKSSIGNPVELNAHHILNWKDYPDLHFDIDNGITMCDKCHILFHRIYGKKNTSKEQLDEFIYNYGKKVC